MRLTEYKAHVESLPYGKRLPNAVYLHLGSDTDWRLPPLDLVCRYVETHHLADRYNVVKFRTDAPRFSLLHYPDFFDIPHPELRESLTVDLVTGKARATSYDDSFNPPILHRKEALLPARHPRRSEFESLTAEEEAEDLYEHPTLIGFKLNWEQILEERGLYYEGHHVRRRDEAVVRSAKEPKPTIARHKTALVRSDLSKPVKSLIEHGILDLKKTFFDYGCGLGSDVVGLRSLGYQTAGWDPAFCPSEPRFEADVVNLGYVLNVIEDPAERVAALAGAFRLAKRVLVVAALINETVDVSSAAAFNDGVLTNRGTFQKFFEQHELQQYIEDVLETPAAPVALGIFFVFRDPAEHEDFLRSRTRRAVDWSAIHARLVLPPPRTPRAPGKPRAARVPRLDRYEVNRESLEPFWAKTLELGRMPLPEEYPASPTLVESFGSVKKAFTLCLRKLGSVEYNRARALRRNDLLVYLALANLRKRIPFMKLSLSLRTDIKTFFGDYGAGLQAGFELLRAAADPGEIELACEELAIGWQDAQALYVHRTLLDQLPPVLRAYVGCATALFGDVEQADIIKMHKASGKVTFLVYEDFEHQPLPQLKHRIKVNLRTRWVEAFDHTSSGQLLYFKERFLDPKHPNRSEMEACSEQLRKLGILEIVGLGPSKNELARLLEKHGLTANPEQGLPSPS